MSDVSRLYECVLDLVDTGEAVINRHRGGDAIDAERQKGDKRL